LPVLRHRGGPFGREEKRRGAAGSEAMSATASPEKAPPVGGETAKSVGGKPDRASSRDRKGQDKEKDREKPAGAGAKAARRAKDTSEEPHESKRKAADPEADKPKDLAFGADDTPTHEKDGLISGGKKEKSGSASVAGAVIGKGGRGSAVGKDEDVVACSGRLVPWRPLTPRSAQQKRRQQMLVWGSSIAFGVSLAALASVVLFLVVRNLSGQRKSDTPAFRVADVAPAFRIADVAPARADDAPAAEKPKAPAVGEPSPSLAEAPTENAQPLPEGWQAILDKRSGRVYYHNKLTGKTQWSRPGEKAPQATRLLQFVDSSCVIEIDLPPPAAGQSASRRKDWHAPTKKWSLNSNDSKRRIASDDASSDPEKALDAFLQDHTMLCKVVASRARVLPEPKLAVITLANTWSYVLQEEKHKLRLWDGMVARLEYTELHGFQSYIWLGKLPLSILGWREGDELPETNCTEAGQGFHVMKALAALAAFELEKGLEAVVYMDADTIPANVTVTPMEYLEISPKADFIGTSNHHLPILMNGGVWILRNTPWGKRLMQKWWQNRCGFADQGALWHSLFELWAEEVKDFTYSKELFQDYGMARSRALRIVTDSSALQREARGSHLSCSGTCREVYKQSGCLSQALLLPHVLVLPVVPHVVPPGRVFLPLQHHMGQAQWLCHFDTSSTPLQCYSEDDDTFNVVGEAELPLAADMQNCVQGEGGAHGFGCDCHELLHGRIKKKRVRNVKAKVKVKKKKDP